jgi:D-3-phosphoglycerate dehydrogenase
MTYTIVVATDLADDSLNVLRVQPDLTVKVIAPNLPEVLAALADADALIARDDVPVSAVMLDNAPNLKVVGRVGAALTGIDFEKATRRGVLLTHTPGTSAIAAAEHTIALMLGLSRRLNSLHESVKSGNWPYDRRRQAGLQLSGKTLGIIGLGKVGRAVAQRALAFGMTVLAFDPYLSEDQVEESRVFLVGLGELLTRSDIVSLHVPPTPETRGMVSAEFLQRMKAGARLINTAFGDLLDEVAVAEAVRSGRLGGLALDVYRQEPPVNSPLIGLENVLHTPHVAENTVEAAQDLSLQIVHQVIDALRGTDYRNVANLPFLPGMDYETIRPYLTLAERIGTLVQLLARHPVKRVAVEFRGEEVVGLVKPLTVALLKGLLAPILGPTVSYINAPMLAYERGIQVAQTKGLRVADYANLVSCQVTLEDGEEIVMAGTLLAQTEAHIVQINEYRMNFVPEGHLLVMGSYDQPGVIGRVGTLMAENAVNIASWFTGRAEPGGQSMTVLSLDQPMAEAVFQKLLALEFVRHAHQVHLG